MHDDKYYQDLIDSITDPIMIIDKGCRISMVNDALIKMQEDAREKIIGRDCFQILHHQDMPCQMPDGECPHMEVFETGRPVRVTHRHYTKSNSEIVVELTASPLRDEHGKVARMIEVMRDVTAERNLREENRQSLDFLTSVLEGIGEGVVVMDREYRILSANNGYLGQVGMDKKEVLGRRCYEVSHHFDSHCMENGHDCPVKAVFETCDPATAMHTHYDRRNEKVFVECRAYPIKDSSGRVIRAIETLNNVTERVLLEKKVRESEEKYRDLYDNAPDGYYSLDGGGIIVEMNRTFFDMLGYEREEIIGRKCIEDLLAKESADMCRTLFPEFKKTGQMRNIELIMLKKDGSPLPVMMNATAIYDAEGGFVMSRSVIRDIMDRRKANEEKKKLQEQLFQSQKLEALGTLAGGIAHDFNNLLSSIMGYASLAKADLGEDDPVHHYANIIETASLRASELTQQLLAFAKGGKYDARPNDVNNIIREVLALLSRTIDKNVSIDVRMADDLRPAICDAGQVEQAILNICINAWDAMPNGGRLIIETKNVQMAPDDVKTLVDVLPGDYVVVSVSDTGVGMNKETREHIFDPFFTTKEKGTGLGLSLSYGILKKHNGFISVESEIGRGSTFRVSLPACMGAETCVERREKTELRRGSGTILVVDDEPMVRNLVRDMLKRFGYTVITAGGGEEALEQYRQPGRTVSLVILDMVMPNMGGREIFTALRKIDPGVRVIVSSGYSHDRDADELLKSGASGFIQKPYRIADILGIVEKAMGNI